MRCHICLLPWVFFLAQPSLSAQNGMFVPFGQSKAEFEEYLETRDYIRRISRPHTDTMINLIDNDHWATYFFDHGVLYGIEDVRVYHDEEVAERVIESCLDYMSLSTLRTRTLRSKGDFRHYALVEGDRIVELRVYQRGPRRRKVTTLHLKATSRVHGPRLQTEAYANQIVRN